MDIFSYLHFRIPLSFTYCYPPQVESRWEASAGSTHPPPLVVATNEQISTFNRQVPALLSVIQGAWVLNW